MTKKPYVIAVAGGTCSGKSTITKQFVEDLEERYHITALHTDSYFKRPGITTIAPVTGREYAEHNHPDAVDQERLFADFQAALSDEANDIVIVEGLFGLYFPELYEKADVKVYIDLRPDQRLYRRITRWMGYGQSLEEICDRYVDTVSFRHDELIEPTRWRADIVINGMLDLNRGKEILEKFVIGEISK